MSHGRVHQNHCFEIFEVFSFNRTDEAFEIFGPNGDSGHYDTIGGPQARGHPKSNHHLPKALRIFVRICSQVPAKVPSALLVPAQASNLHDRIGKKYVKRDQTLKIGCGL